MRFSIQTWQPWGRSAGPRTPEGRAKSSQNAFKGSIRPQLRAIGKALRNQQDSLDDLITDYDSMAETVVQAAGNGNPWAIRELARAMDD